MLRMETQCSDAPRRRRGVQAVTAWQCFIRHNQLTRSVRVVRSHAEHGNEGNRLLNNYGNRSQGTVPIFAARETQRKRKDFVAAKMGLSPLGRRERDRSMFSANGLPENCVYRPKNGPVPCRP